MGMICSKAGGALTGDPWPSPSESPTAQMSQPRDLGDTKYLAVIAHHRHDHRSHRRGTNGVLETCTPYTLAILLPPTHEEEPLLVSTEGGRHVRNGNEKCLTHVQCYYARMDMASLQGCLM